MKTNHLKTNYTSGELSPRLHSREDIQKYQNGAATLENFVILPHGGITKRPPTRYVAQLSDSTKIPRLQGFQYSTEQSYMLCFEENLIRIFKDDGIVTDTAVNISGITQANPGVVTTSSSHNLSNGDSVIISSVGGMVELNNLIFTVANATGTTFELSGVNTSAYTAYTSGGTVAKVIEVTTTYTESELQDMRFAQSGNALYIAHPLHKLAKLSLTSNTAWTLTDVEPEDGPFRTINGDETKKFFVAIDNSTVSVSGATQADPVVVTTSSAHGFENGECVTFTSIGGMTQLNGNRYFIIKLSDTTFSLRDESYRDVDGTGYTAYTSGGTVNRTVTKWGTYSEGSTGHALTTDFSFFTSDMVGQLMRLWEPGQSTGISQPIDNTTITNSSVVSNDGKIYGLHNLTGTTTWEGDWRLPTHTRGVVRTSDPDSAEYVDLVFLHEIYSVVQITAVTNTTTAECKVVKSHIPADVITYGTSAWEEGSWSDEHGYPRAIAFHEQRLWAAGTTDDPQTVYASFTDAFESFLDGDEDDNALNFKIASDKLDVIRWMSPGKTLAIGTIGSEYSITASENGKGIAPTNIRATKQTNYGSANYEPVRVGPVVIFPSRFGKPENKSRKLREYLYSFESDNYQAADLTILSEHITQGGIGYSAYSEEPNSVIYLVRNDGQMVVSTYEREQDVVGFGRHIMGGIGDVSGGDPVIETVGVIPGSYGDEVWLTVKRYINGATVRYVERVLRYQQPEDGLEEYACLDCSLEYDGSATTTISGLNHLIGETVSVVGDGFQQNDKTVSSSGTITIDSASHVHIGYTYTSVAESLDIVVGAQMGTAQTRIQNIKDIYLRLYRSLGGQAGINSTDIADIVYRTDIEGPQQSTPALYTGWLAVGSLGGYERSTQLYIKHDDPHPFTVLASVVEVEVNG